jgi:hypothetical protein
MPPPPQTGPLSSSRLPQGPVGRQETSGKVGARHSMKPFSRLQPSHGVSGSKARRMRKHTSRIRLGDRARGARLRRRAFGKVVMRWPLSQEASGRPVSPGGSRNVVGPSLPRVPKGTMRTVSTFSLRFRLSSETIRTQCLVGGLPRSADHISPRRGDGSIAAALIVKANLIP